MNFYTSLHDEVFKMMQDFFFPILKGAACISKDKVAEDLPAKGRPFLISDSPSSLLGEPT